MKKGVKSISGATELKVNEWQTYTVKEWYSDTPTSERKKANVKWAVYHLNNGVPNKILEKTEGKIRFQEAAIGKSYLIVAYVYDAEISTGLKVTVIGSDKKEISSIEVSSKSKKIVYGSTLDVKVQTVGMQSEYLELSLYEDDANGKGHNSINEKNLLKKKNVQVGSNGIAITHFLLEPDFEKIANAYNKSEGSQHEFYVTAYHLGSLKASSDNINVANPKHVEVRKDETTKVINGQQPPKPKPVQPYKAKAGTPKPTTASGISKVTLVKNGSKKLLATIYSTGLVGKKIRFKLFEDDYVDNDPLVNKDFSIKSDTYKIDIFLDKIPQSKGGDFWEEGNYQELFLDVEVLETKKHIISKTIDVNISEFKIEVADNKTTTSIDGKESLMTAYFAKKEYSRKTTVDGGTYEYTFGGTKANNKTSTAAQKEAVANAILTSGKVNDKLKPEKRYTTKEAIITALKAEEYGKDTVSNKKVSFNTFKLGPVFVRINSAPLDEKVYLVAQIGSLDGKTVKIKIKEKDGIIKGSADAVLPVLELTEQQMIESSTSKEVQGTEKSEFKATVKNGIAKVPIRLRPKSDEELIKWKEKITKGKKEGEYTYKFNNESGTIITSENKAKVAAIIIENAKAGKLGNSKIAEGKTAYKEDVETVLLVKTYKKGDTIKFPTYKKETEMLWLDVSCSGDKAEHKKEFLKKDGSYFTIGKVCDCEPKIRAFMRVIRIAEGTGEYLKGTKQSRDPQLGYTTWFSGAGNDFILSDDHPRVINSNSSNTLRSSAAGAYQIMSWKYDELNGYTIVFKDGYFQKKSPEEYIEKNDKAKKYDSKGFSKLSQDRLCIIILKSIGTITKLLNDDIKGAISNSSGTWVSLPGATAGQPTAKMQETLDYYNEFLKEELSGRSNLHIKTGFLNKFDIKCNCHKNDLETNEFGLVQVTKLGNPYIINSGIEDKYSYTKKDGTMSSLGQHEDDWMLPEKAQAFSDAVYKLVKEYPKQKIYLGDCSAYNPSKNLGHSANGAHSNGNAFDCRFLKSDGSGSNDIKNLTEEEVKLSGRFIEILKQSGVFTTFYTDKGKIPGSVHSAGHADHIHGN